MEIRRAYLCYPNAAQPIIDIDNCHVRPAKVYTLEAVSGAGKTSLFRLLAGWFEDVPGSICDLGGVQSLFRECRYIGTHPSLLPWLSVGENLHFVSSRLGCSIDGTLLSRVGLQVDLWHARVQQLSLGMYRRVELLVSLLARPRYLLLDEFFGSIEPALYEAIVQAIKLLSDESIVVVITHDPELSVILGALPLGLERSQVGTVVGLKER